MKWTTKISSEMPDEEKQYHYQRNREIFAIKLLDFLESQTYPLLIYSFEEGADEQYKHFSKWDRRFQNLLYDEYTWELELGKVDVHRHQPFIMSRMEELSWKDLSVSAIDEIKTRIKNKCRNIRNSTS